jgi:hypothetical protein
VKVKHQGAKKREKNVKSAKEIDCSKYKSTAAIFSPQSALCPIHIFKKRIG